MASPRSKATTPDQRIRDLRKEFRALQKPDDGEPDQQRADRLAAFVKAAHDERQLNMAMHTAQLYLDADADAPQRLIDAYLPDQLDDREERLRSLADLIDLSRYIDQPALRSFAEDRITDEALAWVRDAEDGARRHRLRTLASMFDRQFADDIRDRLRFG